MDRERWANNVTEEENFTNTNRENISSEILNEENLFNEEREITQKVGGGPGFLILSSLLSLRSCCFPICDRQRPFKRKRVLLAVLLLFLVAPNTCSLKLYYICPTPGIQSFPATKTGSVLPQSKLAGDSAVTFALFIPEPRQFLRIPWDSFHFLVLN